MDFNHRHLNPALGAQCAFPFCKLLILKDWSGRMDLNHRPPGPEPGALARLRYAPTDKLRPIRPAQAELLDYHSSAARATPPKFLACSHERTSPRHAHSIRRMQQRPPSASPSDVLSLNRKKQYRRKVDAFRRQVEVNVRQTRTSTALPPGIRRAGPQFWSNCTRPSA